jgi:hypothetical protein
MKTRRVNIQVYGDIEIEEAMRRVVNIVNMGRISENGRSYCGATVYQSGIVVAAGITRRGHDWFRVYREGKKS